MIRKNTYKISGLGDLGLDQFKIDKLNYSVDIGTTSRVYIFKNGETKVVVKKGIRIDQSINALREFSILRLLNMRSGEKHFPTPFYVDVEKDIIIMEWIEGKTVNILDDNGIIQIARALSTIHQIEYQKPGLPFFTREKTNQLDRLKNQIEFLESQLISVGHLISKESLDSENPQTDLMEAKIRIIANITRLQSFFLGCSFSVIHYDINPTNTLRTCDGSIIFIDWGQSSIGDRAMDIAKFFYKFNIDKIGQGVFFEEYLRWIEDDDLIERSSVYYLLIILNSLLWRIRFLYVDIKKLPGFFREAKIKQVREKLIQDFNFLTTQV